MLSLSIITFILYTLLILYNTYSANYIVVVISLYLTCKLFNIKLVHSNSINLRISASIAIPNSHQLDILYKLTGYEPQGELN